MASRTAQPSTPDTCEDIRYKNLTISGAGFINKIRFTKKDGNEYMTTELALQQGKIIGTDYSGVKTQRFSCWIRSEEMRELLVTGFFDDEDTSQQSFSLTAKPEETVTCAVTLSGIDRVDIVNGEPTVHSNIIGLGYLAVGNEVVYQREKRESVTQ